jgi:beta-lactamase superfamily II metal-dependent hydrolase
MSKLRVTLIDVGWGDSILLESIDGHSDSFYALVDSNDTSTLRSSHIFLKRFFERQGYSIPMQHHIFQWVLLTHAHADHGQGLKRIMKDYGTEQFWYPKSASQAVFFTDLLRYAQRSPKIQHHQAIDSTKTLRNFGDVSMKILWPPHNHQDSNENNNSIVLALKLGNVCFVLTGDAETDVWTQIANQLPPQTMLFKVPHHGSDNAMFDSNGKTPWLTQLNPKALLAISSHVRPFQHPSSTVVNELTKSKRNYFRTDENYHITIETDGQQVSAKYSH